MIRLFFSLAMLSIMCSCVSTTEPEPPTRTQDSLAILDSLPDTLFLNSVEAIHTRDSCFYNYHVCRIICVDQKIDIQVIDTIDLEPEFSPTTYHYTVKGCSWSLRAYYPLLGNSMFLYDSNSSYIADKGTTAFMQSTEPADSAYIESQKPSFWHSSFKKPLIEQDTAYFQLPEPYTLQLWKVVRPDTSYWAFIKDLSTDSLTGPPLYCESCPCSVSLTTYNQLQMQPVTYTFSTPES